MPLRLPSQSSIHPSPSIVSAAPASTQQLPKCAICHINPSPYTCPTCNIPYCSLICFRDEKKHAGCLATFQGKAEDELREVSRLEHDAEAPAGETEERDAQRKEVLDLLRRFQAEQDGDEGGADLQSLLELAQGQDSDQDSDDESQVGANHDHLTEASLPSSTSALLAMLDKEQRETFLTAVGPEQPPKPASKVRSPASADVHASLQSKERAKKLWEKIVQDEQRRTEGDERAAAGFSGRLWWLNSVKPHEEEEEEEEEVRGDTTLGMTPQTPAFDSEVKTLIAARQSKSAPPPAAGVAWNCIALLTAYTYTLLHLDIPSFSSLLSDATSEEQELIMLSLNLLARLCPFLFALPVVQASGSSSSAQPTTSTDANLLLAGPSSVSAYLLSRLGDRDRSAKPGQLLLELYTKTASLLEQAHVTVDQSNGASKAHGALADIWLLISCAMTRSSVLSALVLPSAVEKATKSSQTKRNLQQASRKLIFYSATCATASNGSHDTLLPSVEILGTPVNGDPQGALSSLQSLSLEGQSSLRPHKSQREAKTLQEEMEMLRGEVNALEDEERWYAARRLEEERLGGGGGAGRSNVMAATNRNMEAAPKVEPIGSGTSAPPAQVTKKPDIVASPEMQAATQKVENGPRAKSFAAKRLARQQREEQARRPAPQTGGDPTHDALRDDGSEEGRQEHVASDGQPSSKKMIQMLD